MRSFYIPVIDNGGGISVTDWGYSLARSCISDVFNNCQVQWGRLTYPYPAGALLIATAQFLAGPCERILIIDTDQSWEPYHLRMLLSHDVPLVAGLYCKKRPELQWIVSTMETEFVADPFAPGVEPLVEVAWIARGFMSIHRSVFESIKPLVPEIHCESTGLTMPEYWAPMPGGHSEDRKFCETYRAAGGKVFADQRVIIGHHGICKFPLNMKLPQLTPSQK